MSKSYLMGASDKDPEMGAFLECRNSFGVGPMIWNALVEAYGPKFGVHGGGSPFIDWDKLIHWLATPPAAEVLTPMEMNVIRMTNTGFYLEGDEDMLLYAKSLRAFQEKHGRPDRVSHLVAVADRIEELVRDKKVRWLSWYLTTVNANPWLVDSENEDDDKGIFNMVKDLDKNLNDADYKAERCRMLPLAAPASTAAHVAP